MTQEHTQQSASIPEAQWQPQGVHLVGSVPLHDAEEVFRTASSILGGRLRRIPDGETGIRSGWIGWQYQFFDNNPHFEVVPADPQAYAPHQHYRLRSPSPGGTLTFETIGYADAALASYEIFSALKSSGTLPAYYRFQVCLPTPIATVTVFIATGDQATVEPAYEAAILRELHRIVAAIPANELAIQWDTAVEFALLEGVMPTFLKNGLPDIVERLIRLGDAVPAGVELGYHLCYGDAGHKHFKEPEDMTKLVEIANALAEGVKRAIDWIHMPVPRNRTDDAYFLPLRHLRLHPETELYLGLVHLTDGVEGTQRRIEAAQRFVPHFGVATECGLGRRAPKTIPELLRIHRDVAQTVV